MNYNLLRILARKELRFSYHNGILDLKPGTRIPHEVVFDMI